MARIEAASLDAFQTGLGLPERIRNWTSKLGLRAFGPVGEQRLRLIALLDIVTLILTEDMPNAEQVLVIRHSSLRIANSRRHVEPTGGKDFRKSFVGARSLPVFLSEFPNHLTGIGRIIEAVVNTLWPF